MAVHVAPRAAPPLISPKLSKFFHADPKTQALILPRALKFNPLCANSRRTKSIDVVVNGRRVRAQAAGRSDFNDSASRLGEEARKRAAETAKNVSDAAKSFAGGFPTDRDDLRRKFRRAMDAANEKLGDFAFESKRTFRRWNREFRVSEQVEEVAESLRENAKRIDREYGIGQKSRALTMDFRRNWPRYKKELDQFLNTPLGRSMATVAFLWFAISGWLFRIIILGTWVLPFAAPFLIGAVARNAVIEGACPACKRRFIGNRNQVIQCMNCRAVVWQPREDFSKGNSNPDIIDIDIEEK